MALSNPKVIETLNRYFVPVYLANVDYREGGSAPPSEKAELQRVHREAHAAGLSTGTVHGFVLSPDGHTVDSRHVAQAYRSQALLEMLDGAVRKFSPAPGDPIVKPAPQSAAQPPAGGLLLHVTARYLERRAGGYTLIKNDGGDWSAIPGEDWIPLSGAEAARLLPAGSPRTGYAWDLDPGLATRILNRFYPPTENNDLTKNRIEQQSMRGTVESNTAGMARARVEGSLRMKHPFYHKDDERFVTATFAGALEWDTRTRKLRSLRIATDDAVYEGGGASQPFGVAVRSLP